MAVNDYIWHLETANPPSQVRFPIAGEELYEIDLNTRVISGPDWLSVQQDHESQLLYFTVDRFYDNQDLSNTVCVIQYETIDSRNKNTFKGTYFIPMYDIQTLKNEEKMILVWQIKNSVSQSATSVKYNFRFYELNTVEDSEGSGKHREIIYNLNTLPTTSKILNTITPKDFSIPPVQTEEENILASEIEQIWETINNKLKWDRVYWEIL